MPLKQLMALLITLAAAVSPWHPYLQDRENTLLKNRNWFTRERQLAKETFKTKEYFSMPQTLAGEQLNLHAWGGYQEALYRQKMQPASIAFDFYVQQDSYVIVLFNTDWEGFQGIRLSGHPDYPSAYVAGDGDGNFVHREVFATPGLEAGDWRHAQLRFTNEDLTVLVDGVACGQMPVALHGPRWVGFRGSGKTSIVDNVAVQDVVTKTWHREDFSPVGLRWWTWMYTYAGALLAMGLGLAAFRLFAGSWPVARSWGIALNLCIAALGFTLLVFNATVSGALYPAQPDFEEEIRPRILEGTRVVGERLARDYPLVAAPDVFRLMFLGTSQTFGCGAGRMDSDFVSLLAQRLREDFAGTATIEVLNASVPGAQAEHLATAYEASWIEYAPRLTVINLSCNDASYGGDANASAAQFARQLRRITGLNRERGIHTIFSLEPLSYEEAPYAMLTHAQMRAVAQELGVPMVDTFTMMQQHKDEGLLWWDIVHPSDAGHARIAAILHPVLRDEIGKLLQR